MKFAIYIKKSASQAPPSFENRKKSISYDFMSYDWGNSFLCQMTTRTFSIFVNQTEDAPQPLKTASETVQALSCTATARRKLTSMWHRLRAVLWHVFAGKLDDCYTKLPKEFIVSNAKRVTISTISHMCCFDSSSASGVSAWSKAKLSLVSLLWISTKIFFREGYGTSRDIQSIASTLKGLCANS